MPFGRGEIDEFEPCAGATRAIGTDRQRQRADLRLGRAHRGLGKRRCEPQHRDVGRGIASGARGRHDGATGRDKLKISLVRQRLFGGNDDAGSPHQPGEVALMRQPDRDHGVRRGFRARDQRARELSQGIGLIGHELLLSASDRKKQTGPLHRARLSAGWPVRPRPGDRGLHACILKPRCARSPARRPRWRARSTAARDFVRSSRSRAGSTPRPPHGC